MADLGEDAEASTPSERLTLLAQWALADSTDEPSSFLNACREYAYGVARRLGRKHHGAEDSAQDAVIVVLKLLKANPPELKPETIGALVRLLVLRSARAAAERRTREANAVTQVASVREAREAPDPAREVETIEWARAVRDVVDALPSPLRRLIDLRHGEDLSTREIARVLGMSQASIMRILVGAEAAIRAKVRGLINVDDRSGGSSRQGRA